MGSVAIPVLSGGAAPGRRPPSTPRPAQRRRPQVDEDVVRVQRPVLAVEVVGIQAHQLRAGRDRPRPRLGAGRLSLSRGVMVIVFSAMAMSSWRRPSASPTRTPVSSISANSSRSRMLAGIQDRLNLLNSKDFRQRRGAFSLIAVAARHLVWTHVQKRPVRVACLRRPVGCIVISSPDSRHHDGHGTRRTTSTPSASVHAAAEQCVPPSAAPPPAVSSLRRHPQPATNPATPPTSPPASRRRAVQVGQPVLQIWAYALIVFGDFSIDARYDKPLDRSTGIWSSPSTSTLEPVPHHTRCTRISTSRSVINK